MIKTILMLILSILFDKKVIEFAKLLIYNIDNKDVKGIIKREFVLQQLKSFNTENRWLALLVEVLVLFIPDNGDKDIKIISDFERFVNAIK